MAHIFSNPDLIIIESTDTNGIRRFKKALKKLIKKLLLLN